MLNNKALTVQNNTSNLGFYIQTQLFILNTYFCCCNNIYNLPLIKIKNFD